MYKFVGEINILSTEDLFSADYSSDMNMMNNNRAYGTDSPENWHTWIQIHFLLNFVSHFNAVCGDYAIINGDNALFFMLIRSPKYDSLDAIPSRHFTQ